MKETVSGNETLSQKRALTISEAAAYACVSRGIVENWMLKGHLPFEELPGIGEKNRFRRIRQKDLDEFLDKTRTVIKRTPRQKSPEEQVKTNHIEIFLLPKSA